MPKVKARSRPTTKRGPKVKRAKPPPAKRDRFAEIVKQREQRAQARDIGPIPAVKNPKRRAACARNLLLFFRTYLPARFPLPFSEDHIKSIGRIERVVLEGGLMTKAAPRGDGKTTRFEGAGLWAALYGHRRFLMLLGASEDHGHKLCLSLRSELEHNELLLEDFPEAVFPIRALDGIARRAEGQAAAGVRTQLVWTDSEVRLPTTAARGGCVIRTSGITGSVRGAKASLADGTQVRPDLVLLDDPQTRESAKSPSQVADRLAIVQGDVLGLAGPGETISAFAAVTVIEKNDLADQLLDRQRHPEWQGERTAMLRSLPSKRALALWEEYGEIYQQDMRDEVPEPKKRATKFYREHQAEMDEGAVATWPHRMERDEISAIQHAMTLRLTRGQIAFDAEYQNNPPDPAASSGTTQLEATKISSKVNQHKRGVVPKENPTLTAFVDVQGPILLYVVTSWGNGFRGDVVDYGTWPKQDVPYFAIRQVEKTYAKVFKDLTWEAALYAALGELAKELLPREWHVDDSDAVLPIDLMLVDANWGESTDTVYSFCRRSGFGSRIMPSHGRGVRALEKPMSTWAKKTGDRNGLNWRISSTTNRQVRHVLYDTNYWKTFVASRLLAAPGSAGCLSLFGEKGTDHRLFSDHCASELRTRVTARERTVDEWQMRPGTENHWWDGIVGSAVAASIRGVVLDADGSVAAERAAPKEKKPEPAASRPGGGWMGGFGSPTGSGGRWL